MVNENPSHLNAFQFQAIGRVSSCYKEKFGIPRQPGLVPEARASIEILPPYDRDEAFRGLESVSHVWVIFVFHQAMREAWRPTVRPPRLGGNQRIGVFATRSNFRPNPIGLSLLRLDRLERREGRLWLDVSGGDLLEGSPVLDIKPYIPYADSAEGAEAGIANLPPESMPVVFSPEALAQVKAQEAKAYPGLQALITQTLGYDPRPAYQQEEGREYGMRLYDLNLRFTVRGGQIEVLSLARD